VGLWITLRPWLEMIPTTSTSSSSQDNTTFGSMGMICARLPGKSDCAELGFDLLGKAGKCS